MHKFQHSLASCGYKTEFRNSGWCSRVAVLVAVHPCNIAEQQREKMRGGLNDTPDENSPLIPGSHSVATDENATPSYSEPAIRDDKTAGRKSKLFVTVCILLTELCERLTFYGLSGNLLLFCSEFLNFESPWPTTITYLFQG